ncbi:MAG: hypothetical protein ACFB50_08365 [Rubrobacteraceae bacterium]
MNTSTLVSGQHFKICPLCEASRLVFSGPNEARCPACDCEPSDAFLVALRQIVSLPETPEASPDQSGGEIEARRSGPKKRSDGQGGDR